MGTVRSGLLWEVVFISLLLIMMPISIGFSQGVLFAPEKVVDYNPETQSDLSMTYTYINETGSSMTGGNLYTTNETGADNHEFITPVDNGTMDNMIIALPNYNISQAIDEGMTDFYFRADFPYSGNVSMELKVEGSSNSESLVKKTINTTTDMDTYEFSTEVTDLLYAEDQTESSASIQFVIYNNGNDDATGDGNVLPATGSSLLFMPQVITDTNVFTPLASLNVVSGLWAIILGFVTVNSTPWFNIGEDVLEKLEMEL